MQWIGFIDPFFQRHFLHEWRWWCKNKNQIPYWSIEWRNIQRFLNDRWFRSSLDPYWLNRETPSKSGEILNKSSMVRNFTENADVFKTTSLRFYYFRLHHSRHFTISVVRLRPEFKQISRWEIVVDSVHSDTIVHYLKFQ